MNIAAIAAAIALVTAIAGGTVAVEGRYATKTEVAGVTLLVLYTQFDRAQAELRQLQRDGEHIPRSLLDSLARLCREIQNLGGKC